MHWLECQETAPQSRSQNQTSHCLRTHPCRAKNPSLQTKDDDQARLMLWLQLAKIHRVEILSCALSLLWFLGYDLRMIGLMEGCLYLISQTYVNAQLSYAGVSRSSFSVEGETHGSAASDARCRALLQVARGPVQTSCTCQCGACRIETCDSS